MLAIALPLVAFSGVSASQHELSSAGRVNPIRRVVTLLQDMQAKVTTEGKKEEELYDKFRCYCKNGAGELQTSIGAADTKIPQVESAIGKAEALLKQLEMDLTNHKADRADAKEALATAAALREKEAAAYAKESGDLTTNIAALEKAIKVLSDGMAGGSFLQTATASALRQIAVDADMNSADRDMLTAFLSQSQGQGYVPQSGQIVGILKQLQDTMKASLAEVQAAEEAAQKAFKGLAAAKTKEIQANTDAIESKTVRHGETGVQIVNLKEDLDDTQKALAADQQFLADLDKNCDAKKAEWEERSRTRAQELVALADTIRILNDDDALELFKKTLPTPSLMQTTTSVQNMKHESLAVLKSKGNPDSKLSLIAMALRGQSNDFQKIIKMIDDMVALLGDEQVGDDRKKAYCEAELDKAEDKLKGLDIRVADLEKAIDDANGQVATLTDEIQQFTNDIEQLDKDVADATALRKQEHADNAETVANDSAAKQLLDIAKNRLAKFYTPKLYKAAPKTELSAENRVVVSMGGTVAPTPAPGGIAGTGVVAFAEVQDHDSRVAPPPPPETWDAYTKKGEEHTGVVEMLNMLKADLDKEIQETEVNEKENQREYETFMADSAAKRAADTKSIAMKEATKADLGAAITKMSSEKGATMKEAMATAEFIKDLHLDCDWLLANFQARKDARAGEVESLKNAKSVLSGASYSLISVGATRNLLRRTATCPSTSVQCGMQKDAAGDTVFVPHALPEPGACVNVAAAIPEDGQFKICGPGKFTISRMSCDKHDYKSVTIEQATDQFSASDCKTYRVSDYYAIKGYIGSATYTCDATAR